MGSCEKEEGSDVELVCCDLEKDTTCSGEDKNGKTVEGECKTTCSMALKPVTRKCPDVPVNTVTLICCGDPSPSPSPHPSDMGQMRYFLAREEIEGKDQRRRYPISVHLALEHMKQLNGRDAEFDPHQN